MKDILKDKPRIKKIKGEMLNPKVNQGALLRERCHTWRRKWIK